MRRSWFHRLALPIWAAWIALAVTERPLSFDCWMHEAAGARPAATAASAAHSAMHHRAHQGTSGTAAANCCGCLGDCGTAPVAMLPDGSDAIAIRPAPIVHHTSELVDHALPVARVDLALPYANAPPLFSLI